MGQSLLITLREGLEAGLIVVIILAYLRNAGHGAYWNHVLMGTAAAVAASLVTGVLLILFAAGILAHGLHEFHDAGLLPPTVQHVWDINGIPSDEEGVREWLKGIFGYNGNPSLVEVVAYPLYLGVAFWCFSRGRAPARRLSTQLVAEQGTAS